MKINLKINFQEIGVNLYCKFYDNYNILFLFNDLFVLLIRLPIIIVGSYFIMLFWALYRIILNIFNKIIKH